MRRAASNSILVVPVLMSLHATVAGCNGEVRSDPIGISAPFPTPHNLVDDAQPVEGLGARAVRADSCEDLATKRRAALVAGLARDARRGRDYFFAHNADACAPFGPMDAGIVTPPVESDPGPSATTGTNVQVEGVDEPDFVKNDGHNFYVLAEGKFQIVEAWPAANTHRVGQLDLSEEGTPLKLLLEGRKAIVYVRARTSYTYYGTTTECAYGYSCVPSDDGSVVRMLIVDFTNPASPVIERRVDLPGSLQAARKVGSRVHTVVARRPMGLFTPRVDVDKRALCDGHHDGADVYAAYDRAFAAARAAVLALPASAIAPTVVDDGIASGASCKDVWVQQGGQGESLLTVASFDAALAHGAVTTASIMSEPGFVYASAEHVYVASPDTNPVGMSGDGSYQADRSFVHRFAFGDASSPTRYEATGEFEGKVINSFAMDEREGYLRVAASVGHAPDPRAHSVLSVLERSGASLDVVAKIDDIAPSEDIRSVRFLGDRAYVVTFKKTDPLWVFDVANARLPRALGELHIPGFSTYMHPIDANTLLTIGFNAADQGSFAWFTSLRLQLLDVANPAAPRLLFAHDIGTRGTSSDAATNHLAFTYFPEKRLLAVPVDVCEGGRDGSAYGDRMTFSGLAIFGVDRRTGFTAKGGVAHRSAAELRDASCGAWWSSSTSRVQRSAFFDDFVYSIAPDRMKVQDTRALGRDLATVVF